MDIKAINVTYGIYITQKCARGMADSMQIFAYLLVLTVTMTKIRDLVPAVRVKAAQRSRTSSLRTSLGIWVPTGVRTLSCPPIIYVYNCVHITLLQSMEVIVPIRSFSICTVILRPVSPSRILRSIHTTADMTPQLSSAIQTTSPLQS